jgi:hypothetical protein
VRLMTYKDEPIWSFSHGASGTVVFFHAQADFFRLHWKMQWLYLEFLQLILTSAKP